MKTLLFYRWDPGPFGPCSASCGGGERVRPVRCVQKHGADVVKVPFSDCPSDTAPVTVEICNRQHCPARYEVVILLNMYVFKSYPKTKEYAGYQVKSKHSLSTYLQFLVHTTILKMLVNQPNIIKHWTIYCSFPH